jgi:hypothetical protein
MGDEAGEGVQMDGQHGLAHAHIPATLIHVQAHPGCPGSGMAEEAGSVLPCIAAPCRAGAFSHPASRGAGVGCP